jgi:integral membrane protein
MPDVTAMSTGEEDDHVPGVVAFVAGDRPLHPVSPPSAVASRRSPVTGEGRYRIPAVARPFRAKPPDHGALTRYRVLAYTTAVLLIVLVFVGVPLQVWDDDLWVVRVVGTMHGYLYLVYLLVAFEFTRRLRLPLVWMVLVLLAGTIPFCAIVAERLLTRRYERMVDEGDSAALAPSVRAP